MVMIKASNLVKNNSRSMQKLDIFWTVKQNLRTICVSVGEYS